MARCIYKPAEQPPLFMETTKYARNPAAREVLGNSVSPAFFSLTADTTFVIAYDFYGFFKDQSINFFVTPPIGKNRPVMPIFGKAVIFRCEPIDRFTDRNQDYRLVDCTEEDLIYVKTGLLRNDIQNQLFFTAERTAKEIARTADLQNPAAQILLQKLSRWAKIHDRSESAGFIGKAINQVPTPAPFRDKELELKEKFFNSQSFIRYCEGWGMTCTCPTKNMALLKSQNAYWKIWHSNCFVTDLEQGSIVLNEQKNQMVPGQFEKRPVPEQDIYLLAKHISKLRRYGLS